MKSEFNLTIFEQSTIVTSTIIGAWIFSLISGYSSDRFGRKPIILLSSIIFTIGSLTMGFANSSALLILGRFILGIAIGFSSSTIPVYIAEITQYHQRGRLVTSYNALITGGQFFAGLIAGIFSTYSQGWRYMINLAVIPSGLQTIYFIFAPESPRYLLKIGKEKEAFKSLNSLRCSEVLTEIEFRQIKSHFEKTEQDKKSTSSGVFKVLKQVKVNVALRRALILGCTLQLIQQLAGINTIMYYSATIIEQAGIENKSKAIWLSSVTGLVNFMFTFVGLTFVERLGRRKLILFSVVGVCVSLLFLSGSFYVARFTSPSVTRTTEFNSTCSSVSACNSCVQLSKCGFCFVNNGDQFESTCLTVDENDLDHSITGWCSRGYNQTLNGRPIFAFNNCPSDYAYLIVLGLVFYLVVFASGLGSQPWVINSEIYPLEYRSGCFSLAVAFNWLSNTIVSLTFLPLIQLLTETGTFLIYFLFALIGLVYFYFELPETKGRSLEEIESLFIKPKSSNVKNYSSCK